MKDVKGHEFPALPDGCTGSGWELKSATHPGSRPAGVPHSHGTG
jgi:hypothetical protein